MAVPALDPRVNADRIYRYSEYKVLSATFKQRKARSSFRFIPPFGRTLGAQPKAIRLLGYKVAMAAGLAVLLAAVSAMAFFDADTARLAYAQQEYQASLSGLEQSLVEATGANQAKENAVVTGDVVSPAEVVYPGRTRYLVLTNIPDARGRELVNQLYPLSRNVIKVEP